MSSKRREKKSFELDILRDTLSILHLSLHENTSISAHLTTAASDVPWQPLLISSVNAPIPNTCPTTPPFFDNMDSILKSGRFSDFKITCKGKEWNVHKAILCYQSDYFSTMFESGFKEKANDTIDLSSDEAEHVQQLLNFLYTGDYEDIASEEQDETKINDTQKPIRDLRNPYPDACILQRHIAIYVLGDKYLIKKLTEKAAAKFKASLPQKWTANFWCLMEDITKIGPTGTVLQDSIVNLWLKDSIELLKNSEFGNRIKDFPTTELTFLRGHVLNIHAELETSKRAELIMVNGLVREKQEMAAEFREACRAVQKDVNCWNCHKKIRLTINSNTRHRGIQGTPEYHEIVDIDVCHTRLWS
ncbi:hypothetical protein TWF696_007398 [Orbilia brochopaga]|uniref:BTB domain-containing protein n=1 Tax=Orbilia brochopaga TaxID=3140254 RepID=A0AAV9UW25_9PEZI